MTFPEWIIQKYHDWAADISNTKVSEAAFARWLKVNPQVFSDWKFGKKLPEGDSIQKLAARYGTEAFDILGIELEEHERLYWEMSPALKVMTPEERALLKETGRLFADREFYAELSERVRQYRLRKE